jgi:hypothetical protein
MRPRAQWNPQNRALSSIRFHGRHFTPNSEADRFGDHTSGYRLP